MSSKAGNAEDGRGRKRSREDDQNNTSENPSISAKAEASANKEASAPVKGSQQSSARVKEAESRQLNSYLQILGTDTGDCCPSIQIFTGSSRLLFNAGDGLQVP